MFSDKKENAAGLPDLPPVQSAFGSRASLPPVSPPQASQPFSGKPESSSADKRIAGSSEQNPSEDGMKVVEMHEWTPTSLPAPPSAPAPTQQPEQLPPLPQLEESSPPSLPSFPEMREERAASSLPELPQQSLHETPPEHRRPVSKPSGVDVFVKIDKFHSAKKTLRDVGDRLEEIDSLIKKIRETKLREEQEIASWEKDVVHAKARIQEISENIFEKVG